MKLTSKLLFNTLWGWILWFTCLYKKKRKGNALKIMNTWLISAAHANYTGTERRRVHPVFLGFEKEQNLQSVTTKHQLNAKTYFNLIIISILKHLVYLWLSQVTSTELNLVQPHGAKNNRQPDNRAEITGQLKPCTAIRVLSCAFLSHTKRSRQINE